MKLSSLNYSLSIMENVVLTNLNLYQNFEDKIIYVESFYKRYFSQVFGDSHYITEVYKHKFTKKIIFESKFNFTQHVKNINHYIRRAIKFDILNEQKSDAFVDNQSNELLKGAGVRNQKDYDTVKKATNATSKFSWSEFFESIRTGLSSTIGQISTTILELIKPLGHSSVVVVWGGLALYDFFNYHNNSDFGSLSKFLVDIIAIGLTFLNTPGEDKLISTLGKKTFRSIDEFVRFFAEDPMGKTYFSFMSFFVGIMSKIMSYINKGATWLKDKFNVSWPSKITGYISKFIDDLKKAFIAAGIQPITGKTSQKNYQTATQDSSKPQQPHLQPYLKDAYGRPVNYKPKPWEKLPVVAKQS